jgi:hypothetical protein
MRLPDLVSQNLEMSSTTNKLNFNFPWQTKINEHPYIPGLLLVMQRYQRQSLHLIIS